MITLMNGDCIEEMNKIDATSIDCFIFDLPFKTTKNKWESIINLDHLWIEIERLAKPAAPIIFFAAQPFTTKLINSNPDNFAHKWVWEKEQAGNFVNAKLTPLMVDEDILVFSADGKKVNYFPIMRTGKLRTKGGKASFKNGRGFGGLKNISYKSDQYYPTSILKFAGVPRIKRLHSAQKPVALLEYLIKTYSKESDTILDCTMGSGSTGEACMNLARNFIGIEKDYYIFKDAENRLNSYTL